MEMATFLRGLVIGFSIAAPVGPIGILCIRRTLAEGRLAGFISGIGAASADAVYGSIAAFGLTSISVLLVDYQNWLRLVGGGFLVYLGLRTFFDRPADTQAADTAGKNRLVGHYASTFLLTLTNPMTILSFAAIFAGLGIGIGDGSYWGSAAVVLGVFCGSAAWWLLLSNASGFFRWFLTGSGKVWINRISGAIILCFGFAALAGILIRFF